MTDSHAPDDRDLVDPTHSSPERDSGTTDRPAGITTLAWFFAIGAAVSGIVGGLALLPPTDPSWFILLSFGWAIFWASLSYGFFTLRLAAWYVARGLFILLAVVTVISTLLTPPSGGVVAGLRSILWGVALNGGLAYYLGQPPVRAAFRTHAQGVARASSAEEPEVPLALRSGTAALPQRPPTRRETVRTVALIAVGLSALLALAVLFLGSRGR